MKYRVTGRRKAAAGIVAAVIMFSMLFTVGTAYFLFVNTENMQYVQSLVGRSSGIQDRASELMILTTLLTSTGTIGFYSNDTGPLPINVTSTLLFDTAGTVLKCLGMGLPGSCTNSTPPLPITVNPAKGTATIDTGYVYTTGTVAIKVTTSRGNVFSAFYPPSNSVLAARALSSGAIGDIYLQPSTFTYYSIVACGVNSCLQKQGLGFAIAGTFATTNQLAFSISVNDLNPTKLNVTLDANTLLADFFTPRGTSSSSKNVGWFIISNTSTTIQTTYTPITLLYNKPVTLVFASSTPSVFTPFIASTAVISPPAMALVFILTHGCKGMAASKCSVLTVNYAQNSPYVATQYY